MTEQGKAVKLIAIDKNDVKFFADEDGKDYIWNIPIDIIVAIATRKLGCVQVPFYQKIRNWLGEENALRIVGEKNA